MKLMFLFFKTLDEWAILIHFDCGLSRVPGHHEFINLYVLYFLFLLGLFLCILSMC